MRTDLGAGHSRLSPPIIPEVSAPAPPLVVRLQAVAKASPQDRNRRPRTNFLRRPTRVFQPEIGFFGPEVTGQALERANDRRRTFYELRPPVVVTQPVAFIAAPVDVHLAPSSRGQPSSLLRLPAILAENGVIQVTIAPQRRGAPTSFLRPPTDTIGLEDQGHVLEHLTYSRRGAPKSRLSPPTVVAAAAAEIFFGPDVHLIRIKSPQFHSLLREPSVVGAGIVFAPLRVKLVAPRATRPAVHPRLAPPVFQPPGVEILGPEVTFAYSRKGAPTYQLFPPIVGEGIVFSPLRVKLAPLAVRPVAKSALRAPIVVGQVVAEAFYGPRITLVSFRPPAVKSHLFPPTDTIGLEDQGKVLVSLAPSFRGTAKSELKPPTVVFLAVELSGPEQWLTYSRRPITKSELRPPADITEAEEFPVVRTRLTYSRRGTPKSVLRQPTVVFTAVELSGPEVTYVRITPPPTVSLLKPPTVVDQAVVALLGPEVHLTYSRHGQPKSALKSPTVVFPFFARQTLISLAPQARGVPKSRLQPPVVVFLAVEIYGPEVHFTRIKPPPTIALLKPPSDITEAEEFPVIRVHLTYSRRPVTKSELKPPTVVAPVVSYGPFQWLTYSRRGEPTSFLREPAVVAVAVVIRYFTAVHLTYSRRGRPTYFLNPPTRVFPFIAEPLTVSLAPQSRGIPQSFLEPPTVLKANVPLSLNLTYSRRGEAKSLLKPPTVVRQAVEILGPETWLTYSRRPKTRSQFFPELVGKPPFRPLAVHLTYSRRGRPISFQIPFTPGKAPFRPVQVHLTTITPRPTVSLIKPPSVVLVPTVGVLSVHLTRITPPPVLSLLKPPSVVGGGIAFYGPQTWLTRITPPKVIHALRLTLVAFTPSRGDVCGFDIAGSFVCGSSQTESKVTGTESATDSVCGSDRKAT